jgi:3-hydroxyacyl-CoA dehydrogenase
VNPGGVRRAGIVGAGTMGSGIAIVFAAAGIPATVVDPDVAALHRASAAVGAYFDASVAKGRLDTSSRDAKTALIGYSADLDALVDADAVIEAVFEDLDLKRGLFERLGRLCGPRVLLATNTSTLDVDAIVGGARDPQRALGLHFFSPAPVMKLVEIVRGSQTSEAALREARALTGRLGKLGVEVGNCDGFVGNRMLLRYRREAELLLEAGATPAQVDAALEAFGFKMGPFAVSDLAGLDIAYRAKIERAKRGGLPFRQSRIPDRLVEMGRLGRKTGAGYYHYVDGGRVRQADEGVVAIVADERARLGIAPRDVSAREIVERCLLALYAEGERILHDGVASSAADIDTIWRAGYGFPEARVGPMHYGRAFKGAREKIAEYALADPAFWGGLPPG